MHLFPNVWQIKKQNNKKQPTLWVIQSTARTLGSNLYCFENSKFFYNTVIFCYFVIWWIIYNVVVKFNKDTHSQTWNITFYISTSYNWGKICAAFSSDACFFTQHKPPFWRKLRLFFFSFFSESASEGLRGPFAAGRPNVRHNKQAGRTVLRVTISRFLPDTIPPTTTHIQTSKLKKILSICMPWPFLW